GVPDYSPGMASGINPDGLDQGFAPTRVSQPFLQGRQVVQGTATSASPRPFHRAAAWQITGRRADRYLVAAGRCHPFARRNGPVREVAAAKIEVDGSRFPRLQSDLPECLKLPLRAGHRRVKLASIELD